MGSLEEEELVEMVHDFMEYSESSPRRPLFSSSSNCLPPNNQTQYFTLQVFVPYTSSKNTSYLQVSFYLYSGFGVLFLCM